MPGPPPKNPAIRQRRNKATTRSTLPAEKNPISRAPSLPENPTGDWNVLTKKWWADIWSSPLRDEFLRADLGALFRLAILVDMFWKTGKLSVATEIRLLEREFGLTPLSRRRLEWSVTTAEESRDIHEMNRANRAQRMVNVSDPRESLS